MKNATCRNLKSGQKTAISKPLEPFTDLTIIKKIRETVYGIHGLDDAIKAMGSSNKRMGIAMGAYREGRDHYNPSTISHWRHPRAGWSFKIKRAHLHQVGCVLDDWVKSKLGRDDVRFDMTVNSPWKCALLVRCGCGHWQKLDLRRSDWTRCRECAK